MQTYFLIKLLQPNEYNTGYRPHRGEESEALVGSGSNNNDQLSYRKKIQYFCKRFLTNDKTRIATRTH